jgi:Tfp pilus assembly protein PilZ
MNEKTNTDLIAKRYSTQEPARIEVYGRQEVLFCRMNNLSSTGAFFEISHATKNTPRIGDLVQVTVNLKQVSKTHIVNGEVIWCKGLGLGISFIKQKELIKKLAK